MAGSIPIEAEARIYAVWTRTPSEPSAEDYPEPQIDVLEKRAGENRIRHVDSLSLREYVAGNIDENDADKSLLYRIRTDVGEYELIHGVHVEHALNLIKGRENPKVGTLMEFTQDHIDQLERALEDRRQRTMTPPPHL